VVTLRSVVKTSILVAAVALHFDSTRAQVFCGEVITASTVLTDDLTCAADGLRIGADGVTLDCAGHTIRGPGTTIGTGVSAVGVSGVTITECHVTGFAAAIRAQNSPDLRVARSFLSGQYGGIRCTGCPRTTIEANRIEGHLTQIDLQESPDARIIGNVTAPWSRGGGAFSLRYSPRASISGNRAPEGGAQLFLYDCDDSVIENNELARNADVTLWYSDRCLIRRNTLVRGPAPQPNFGGSVRLSGSSDTLVEKNLIEGLFAISLSGEYAETPSSGIPCKEAARNIIQDNVISDSGYGLLLFGASGNRIVRNRIERTEIGIGVFGQIDPNSDFDVPSDHNVIAANSLTTGFYGIGTWRASANLFQENEITDQWIGLYEGPVGPFSPTPNEYQGNSIAGNRFVGLLVIGGAPLIKRNEFRENGSADPPPAGLEPYSSLLGEARGAIALVPVVGDDFTTFDNADPNDDLLAEPVIGGPGQKNVFLDNHGVDIYALDTRAANAESIEKDNQFKGHEALRIRQDWFGLVRVEDSDGQAVPDAEVTVRDATGATLVSFATGVSGYGPATADPARSQGLSPFEDGGPVASWHRFTEFTVDAWGRRVEFTPYTLLAEAAGETGCTIYSWDGVPGKTVGSQSPDGRYQIGVVQLGTTCPGASSPVRPPR
jgi:parallel beta-helix repeat protein